MRAASISGNTVIIEVFLEFKINIGQNDHRNPYIETTNLFSDEVPTPLTFCSGSEATHVYRGGGRESSIIP